MAVIIGIDTGKHTGLAVWNSSRMEFLAIDEYELHDALEQVQWWNLAAEEAGCGIHVYVEDARQRTWIPREKSYSEMKGRLQGAGSVKRDCTIWEEFLTAEGIPFTMVPPKNNSTKMNAVTFKCVTGWTKQTNEHKRDAAMLVFGKKH